MAESADSEKLLDREKALDYVQGDEDFLKEIYLIFLEEIPERIRSFKESIENQDTEKIARFAHSLKGSSMAIGAIRCHSLSEKLEKTANTP